MNTQKRLVIIFSAFIFTFGYSIFNLFQPDHFPMDFVRGEAFQVNEDLILGPYPSYKELLKLKRMGVTTIVSLMNPDFPIEAPLIKEQDELCRKYELTCVNFPLSVLKLNSDGNHQQVKKVIKYLQSTAGGKYVHCYLGRHRVGLVKKELETQTL